MDGGPATTYGYDGNGNTTSIAGPGGLSEALSYDAQSRLVQVTLGSPIASTIAIAYNAFGQRASYTVTPAGAGGPSLAETFQYRGDQLAQVAYSGRGVDKPYTDTYVYTQDGAPLELLRQQQGLGTATPYWYVIGPYPREWILVSAGGSIYVLCARLPLRRRVLPDQHPIVSWEAASERLQSHISAPFKPWRIWGHA